LSESSGAGERLNVGSRNKLMAQDFLEYCDFHKLVLECLLMSR